MAFYAVSTTAGEETDVAEAITEYDSPHIHAVLAPPRINAYIIVESDAELPVEKAVSDTFHANKVLPGKTNPKEVTSFLTPESTVGDVGQGDHVIVTDGPYKGNNAQVQRVDRENEKVTVELQDEPIPMPVDLPGDQIRPKNEG